MAIFIGPTLNGVSIQWINPINTTSIGQKNSYKTVIPGIKSQSY